MPHTLHSPPGVEVLPPAAEGRPGRSGRPLAAALGALRRFIRPFLLIQATAILLVLAYTLNPAVRSACQDLAMFKARAGLLFVAASAALAGGVLPELAKWLAARGARRGRGRTGTEAGAGGHGPADAASHPGGEGRAGEIVFNIAFFAFNGVVIDYLYRGEARLFGAGASIATVAAKVAFDQFAFSPVWLPVIVALYTWRRHGFRIAPTWRSVRAPGFYGRRVVPLLLPNWCFWIPMVSIIYALPVPLQFLLFVLALAAWSLIMVFIAQGGGDEA